MSTETARDWRSKPRIDQPTRDYVARMWELGFTIREIMADTGIGSDHTVRRIATEEYGLPVHRWSRRCSGQTIDKSEIKRLRADGWSYTDIGLALGCSRQYATNVCKGLR